MREVIVKCSKEDAHYILLILASQIIDKEVIYDNKQYETIPSEGKALENLLNAAHKVHQTYLGEKEVIKDKHKQEMIYLNRKIEMAQEEIKLNDKHMKNLRAQDL